MSYIFTTQSFSVPHTVIDPYGRIVGGNALVQFELKGVTNTVNKELLEESIQEIMDFASNKIWIVEGYTDCVITLPDDTVWNITARELFPDGLMDYLPENINSNTVINVKTNGVELNVGIDKFMIMSTNSKWGINTMNTDYLPMCEHDFNVAIDVLVNSLVTDDIEVSTTIAGSSPEEYDKFSFVTIQKDQTGRIVVLGDSCIVNTPHRHTAIENSVYYVSEYENEITEGFAYIKFTPVNFKKKNVKFPLTRLQDVVITNEIIVDKIHEVLCFRDIDVVFSDGTMISS